MRVCIVGASGKLGQYMVQHTLDQDDEVVGVCRQESVAKLDRFKGRITVIPGATNDPEVIRSAVAGCDGVLIVLVPRGVHHYATGTAQAVLDHARPGARLVFSCGWHITRDGQDVYSWKLKAIVKVFGPLARLARFADLDDQVEACRRVFASDTRWTVVRGSDLEEGESQGLPVWSRHVGDPILESNITRRVDFALFMVKAFENDQLVHEPQRSSAAKRPQRSRTQADDCGSGRLGPRALRPPCARGADRFSAGPGDVGGCPRAGSRVGAGLPVGVCVGHRANDRRGHRAAWAVPRLRDCPATGWQGGRRRGIPRSAQCRRRGRDRVRAGAGRAGHGVGACVRRAPRSVGAEAARCARDHGARGTRQCLLGAIVGAPSLHL